MIPNEWIAQNREERARITADTLSLLRDYDTRLAALRASAPGYDAVWFDQAALFSVFLEYHLHRLGLFMEIYGIVQAHREAIDGPEGLPAALRSTLLAKYAEMNHWATKYSNALYEIPTDMLKATRNMTMPYDEWMSGFEGWLDPKLSRRQFAANVTVAVSELLAGEPFTVTVEVHNVGMIPWDDYRVGLSESVSALGMPTSSPQSGLVLAPGDRKSITLTGVAPEEPGEIEATVTVYGPTRNHTKMAEAKVSLIWR
jgi:hypothetical protein